jgi:hypothetical protein
MELSRSYVSRFTFSDYAERHQCSLNLDSLWNHEKTRTGRVKIQRPRDAFDQGKWRDDCDGDDERRDDESFAFGHSHHAIVK